MWSYDEYDVSLGDPIGAARSENNFSAFKDDVWRRDYSRGLAIVNPTLSARDVDLGGDYEKVFGKQDPAINDGSIVSTLKLAPRDGLIMLKTFQTFSNAPFVNGSFARFYDLILANSKYVRDEIIRLTKVKPKRFEIFYIGISSEKVQGNRKTIAGDFARKYKIILVLKGHNTLVSDKKGNLYINRTGNPGMATAGSGDVLTGMIAAFLAQGLDSFNAAKYAVYLHGLAGDLAVREKTQISLIASDIIAKIPEAIKRCS